MQEYLTVASLMMCEVEQLRGLGLRCSAALGLVAERHRLDVATLEQSHFQWTMLEAEFDPLVFAPE